MELTGKHTVVFGMGKTGEALVRFLVARNARVTVTDNRPAHLLEGAPERIGDLPVLMKLSGHDDDIVDDADLVVLSPGVPHTLRVLERARKAGVSVIGEIELAWRFMDTPILAVTGTNGKTTTTRLAGRMLEHSGKTVFLGGNLGTPLIGYVSGGQRADVAVIEISSFQLDTIVRFRPEVGVLLNISPDHLDRYEAFDAYARSKARLFENQCRGHTAVTNASDPGVLRVTGTIKSRRCAFNETDPERCGAIVTDEGIRIHIPEAGRFEIDQNQVPLPGRHNLENTAAAALAALAAGASRQGVLAALSGFVPDPHRLEYVATINGVAYYNDSKGTNVGASACSVEALGAPVILIAGGKDKFGGYEGLQNPIKKHGKALVLIGEAADKISRSISGLVDIRRASTMAEAVKISAEMAVPGDKVLLSPACSSFDMYRDYAERGRDFCSAVRSLGKKDA